jgi:small subunit ribosomal protein S13
MIRIAGVNLNSKKKIRFALTPIKGIGKTNVKKILKDMDISFDISLSDLSEQQVVDLRNHIESNYILESDLRRLEQNNIKRLIDIGTHRGWRHKLKLPVRGQTTRTNSRTVRGNVRKTAGSGRAKSADKT